MLKTVSSITNAIGALNYKGTWNASTNTPTLASGAGTKGDYYQVSAAGSTSLDGLSNWGVGATAASAAANAVAATSGNPAAGIPLVPGAVEILRFTSEAYFSGKASENTTLYIRPGTGL